VWLDDANPVFRRGLASCLIGDKFCVVGESTRLAPLPDLRSVDILVFDVEGSGLARSARLARETSTHLIGLADSVSEQLLLDAVEAGVAGVLARAGLTPDGFVSTLRTVTEGNGSLPAELLARLLGGLARDTGRPSGGSTLTRRERDVLRLLADGGDTRGIASTLCYSERTVKNVVHDTLMKMNCRTRAHAVAVAARQGLI
jgi:DNA-binding NarL/FixJ family response regulator